jgi:hypothetical protein
MHAGPLQFTRKQLRKLVWNRIKESLLDLDRLVP